ncbi:pilus assembly protein PilP [Salinisphaera sp. SPP-AMP-43]|uniref:pilus assembly protein PilP n=1 Tax=Salinisphaera sp. SPP-AMP-43 TaxID=3121288 RepID=UPI003C6E3D91
MIAPAYYASRALILCGLCLSLVACGSDTDDLHAYVAHIDARKPQPIDPMPEIASYQPASYQPAGRRSPFVAPHADQHSRDNGIRPNLNRALDPLEQFPLDALQMVGTISMAGTTYALISAPDQVVHRVAAGMHLGRHYGRIDAIGANGLTLTEIVPDGNGGYVKRGAALAPATRDSESR